MASQKLAERAGFIKLSDVLTVSLPNQDKGVSGID